MTQKLRVLMLAKNVTFLLLIWLIFINHSVIKDDDFLTTVKAKDIVAYSHYTTFDPLISQDTLSQKKWVDSIMNLMTIKEKVGQLFMVSAYSNKDENHKADVQTLIKDYYVGGLIFMQGSPYKQALLTNHYQSVAKIPLLIGFDGEWGLNMRLDSTYRYPWNLTLGAVSDNDLITQMGQRLGQQCKRMGIHINFAPVVDINTNPENPIIGNRSFGSRKENVAEKATAFALGMQSENVLACAKHFPGHGETHQDSHKTMPVINVSKERLYQVEFYPFEKLIQAGVSSVMTAHLKVPSLENDTQKPASCSQEIITNILKNQLRFEGLIFTDALNMQGAKNYLPPGELELQAFLAGNDILLFPENVVKATEVLLKAFDANKFDVARLDYSVRKILNAKYKAGLNKNQRIDLQNINNDLNHLQDDLLHRALVEQSITLVQNNDNIYPITDFNKKIAYVALGNESGLPFYEMLNNYCQVDSVGTDDLNRLKNYDIVIIGYHKIGSHPWKNYQMSDAEVSVIQKIAATNNTILSVFNSPYSLTKLNETTNIKAIVVAYQNSVFAQELTAQKIMGALNTYGNLPVKINNRFTEGIGIKTLALGRLSYGLPEEAGMSSEKLKKVDSLAHDIIKRKMAPGIQILVSRYGKVIYRKSFGYQTYDTLLPINNKSIFDLASLTKVLGGLPLLMKAEEDQLLNLDDSLGTLFPEFQDSDKAKLSVKRILSHTGRLKTWIPFYKFTLDSIQKKPYDKYYRSFPSDSFNLKVNDKMYLLSTYQDSILKGIKLSETYNTNGYRYSDLFFILTKFYVEKTYHQGLDEMTHNLFFNPMGANTLTYNPLQKFDSVRIVPTEKDDYFRFTTIRGYVHDMTAAMMGGVSGHAGLFGTTNDVAKIMQMYLQEGYYGGHQYFKKSTIDKFNTRYFANEGNRRGLGFDKPDINEREKASCDCVSDSSFGHSGFTGTYTWADPESGLVYVFLSNRTYPNMNNNQLSKQNKRVEIQRLIQESILK